MIKVMRWRTSTRRFVPKDNVANAVNLVIL